MSKSDDDFPVKRRLARLGRGPATASDEDLRDDAAYLSRCSISMINGGIETCDKYKADYAAFDANVDVSKFYVFESQFNVQLFPDGAFVEDNGRGTISFGTCKKLVP